MGIEMASTTELEIDVEVVSSNATLFHYVETLLEFEYFVDKYVGSIKEKYFKEEQKQKIKNAKITQFMFIDVDFITIFNNKQIKELKKEIDLLEREGVFNKEALEVIKKGITLALKSKDLYLKFVYA